MTALPRNNLWLALWWLLWLGIFTQQLLLHTWNGGWFASNPAFSSPVFVTLWCGILAGAVLRVFLWSRIQSVGLLFCVFLAGLIVAGMSGMAFSFLAVPFKHVGFLAALAVIVIHAPIRK